MMGRTQSDSVADVQRELSEELLGEDMMRLCVLVVPADTFDNVKGDFPIGFFVWRLGAEEMPAVPGL